MALLDAGYKLQMLLKILVAQILVTDYYLVLDSDVMAARPIRHLDLFPLNGKATFPDQNHLNWYNSSSDLSQIPVTDGSKCAHVFDLTFGPTPVVLHRLVSLQVIEHMKLTYNKTWMHTTMNTGHLGWTEFSLYHLVACYYDTFDTYHQIGDVKFWQFLGSLDFDTELWIGEHAKTLFIVLQDALEIMTVHSVLEKVSHAFQD